MIRDFCTARFVGGCVFLLLLASSPVLSPPARGQSTTIIVRSGDTAPDGNGAYGTFFTPTLNDAGQVAFGALFTGTAGGTADNTGLFRGGGLTAPTTIARGGQPAPDGNGRFQSFNFFGINDAGQVGFKAGLTGTADRLNDDDGIFLGDGARDVRQVARSGQLTPNGNGRFRFFNFAGLNDLGQAAFFAGLTATTGGSADDRGIFRGDGVTDPVQIVRTGQPAPDGDGTLFTLFTPSLNDRGQVGFYAFLKQPVPGVDGDRVVARGDGATDLVQIARTGQPAPDGNGVFDSFNIPALNDRGQAAYFASLTDTASPSADDTGIFRDAGNIGATQIVRAGQAAPDGNGTFSRLGVFSLNDDGQVAFLADLTGTTAGADDDSGIFRGDGNPKSDLTQIARAGQRAPDGSGTFLSFERLAFNDAGQAAFVASLTGTAAGSAEDNGLFFFDDQFGLLTVAREGDVLLNSTITSLDISGTALVNGRSALNSLGQIAYRFTLANGDAGIALFTVPEPSSALLLALAGFATLSRRRRHVPAQN